MVIVLIDIEIYLLCSTLSTPPVSLFPRRIYSVCSFRVCGPWRRLPTLIHCATHLYIQETGWRQSESPLLSLFLKRNNDDLKKTDERAHEAGPERVYLEPFNKMRFSFHTGKVPWGTDLPRNLIHLYFLSASLLSFQYPDNQCRT